MTGRLGLFWIFLALSLFLTIFFWALNPEGEANAISTVLGGMIAFNGASDGLAAKMVLKWLVSPRSESGFVVKEVELSFLRRTTPLGFK